LVPQVDIETLRESERRQRTHLQVIAQTTEVLGDLDYPNVLADVAEILTAVVSWAGFYRGDSVLQFVEGVDVTSERVRRRQFRPQREHDPAHDVLGGRTRSPAMFRLDVTYPQGSVSAYLAEDIRARVLDATGRRPASALLSLMSGRRKPLGLLAVWTGDELASGTNQQEPVLLTQQSAALEADLATLLGVIARRTGITMDNARLYAREHHIAESLQRVMLPQRADIDGLDVWTHYAPSSEYAQVGGDWYDIVEVDSRTVGFAVGDVVGHDVEAAATMGQLRSLVRAYAAEVQTPGVVLSRIDRLVSGMNLARPASLVYLTARRPGFTLVNQDRWQVKYTRAGHLAPLVLRDGKVHQLDGAHGTLVGYGSGERKTASTELRPGDVLLMYTDGLVERRDRTLTEGMAELRETMAAVTSRDATGIGEEVLARLAEVPEDDVAIVVVRVPDPRADAEGRTESHARRWALAHEPGSIARSRHAVVRSCHEWGMDDLAKRAELVVSELVANAVKHGWGVVTLRLFYVHELSAGDAVDSSYLRIEVEDANPAPPVSMDGHLGRVGGFGMQIVGRLSEWGWRQSGTGKIVWAAIHPE
jgi:serine phosphatase RsbU (regulator of sigma subunit)